MATPELDIATCMNQIDDADAQQARTRTRKVSFAQKVSYALDTSQVDSARSIAVAEANILQDQG